MRTLSWLLVGMIFGFFLSACGVSEEDAQAVSDSCDLEKIKQQNSLTDECRQAIMSLLPGPEDNLADRLVFLGSGSSNQNPLLFFLGSDSDGNPLDLNQEQIVAQIGVGQETTVLDPSSDYEIKSLSDLTGAFMSLSIVQDYSASMRDADLDDSAEIFTDLLNLLPPVFQANVVQFSDSAQIKTEFTDDSSVLTSAVKRDPDYLRGSTALYDGIGLGLEELAVRSTPVRLLVVATDGRENSSVDYPNKKMVYALAKENKIPVVILGSLLSDVTFMKELADETNGVFLYNKTLLALKDEASKLSALLANIQVLEITNQDAQSADEWVVQIGSDEFSIPTP